MLLYISRNSLNINPAKDTFVICVRIVIIFRYLYLIIEIYAKKKPAGYAPSGLVADGLFSMESQRGQRSNGTVKRFVVVRVAGMNTCR